MDPSEAIFQRLAVAKRIFLSGSGKKKVVLSIMEAVKTKSCPHFEGVFFFFLVLTSLLQLKTTSLDQ